MSFFVIIVLMLELEFVEFFNVVLILFGIIIGSVEFFIILSMLLGIIVVDFFVVSLIFGITLEFIVLVD